MRPAWASSVDSLATSSKAARKEPVKGLDACSAPPLSDSVMGEDAYSTHVWPLLSCTSNRLSVTVWEAEPPFSPVMACTVPMRGVRPL